MGTSLTVNSFPSVPPRADEGERGVVCWSGEPSGESKSVGDMDSSTIRSRDFTMKLPCPAPTPAPAEAVAGFGGGGEEFPLRIGESQG